MTLVTDLRRRTQSTEQAQAQVQALAQALERGTGGTGLEPGVRDLG